jgi:monoamine oxidase
MDEVEIAVVGAGLSGLLAAERLVVEHGIEAVRVLEAQDRTGGRIFDRESPGGLVVEGGAQFVGDGQERLTALIERLGLKTFPATVPGKFRWLQEVFGLRFALSPKVDEPASFEALREELETLSKTVPPGAPWGAPDASYYDSITVRDWLNQVKSRSSRTLPPLERLCLYHIGCDPGEISMLYLLYFLHGVGGYHSAVRGAHAHRVVGGPGQICDRLANAVGPERILTGTPIRRVVTTDSHVDLFGDGFELRARRAIVTLQPQLCDAIEFDPPLPPDRVRLQREYRTDRGRSAKVHLVYNSPFWRARGYSGTAVTTNGVVFLDASPPDASAGVLLAFRDTRNRRHATPMLPRYARKLFGSPAGDPRALVETDWSLDPYSRSCVSFTPPGLLTAAGEALRRPHGRVHWAGAETSVEWPAFMEGAVRAAERAVSEVV